MKEKIALLKKRSQKLPRLPGVYLMKKKPDEILYVGKAKLLKSRVSSYFKDKTHSLKNRFLIQQIESIDYIVTENEIEAFLLESSLIKKHRPRYNIRLKDDKAYPYIRLSVKDDFPRFYFERRVKDSHSLYFGPYTEGWTLRTLLDFLNQYFHLRDCSNSDFKTRKRPCLSWEMGACSAPCVQKISKKEYQKNCKKALAFLKDRSKSLVKSIQKQMKSCTQELRFEEAGRLRDQLKAIEMIEKSQSVVQISDKDRDVVVLQKGKEGLLVEILHFRKGRLIGNRFQFFKKVKEAEEDFLLSFLNQYYSENLLPDELLLKLPIRPSRLKLLEKVLSSRKGSACRIVSVFHKEEELFVQMAENNAKNHFQDEIEKTQHQEDSLLEIQKKLKLPKLPVRMECYDVSHWAGSHSVGSQVTFEKGLPLKKDYRLYNLKSVNDGDDYKALQELIQRRLKHKEYKEPDMILIDGGKGQLKAVEKILKDLKQNFPLASLAKDRVLDKKPYDKEIESSGERFYLPGRKNPVRFPSHSKGLQTLLFLRDEAHRFAIKSHRRKRDKNFLT